MAKYLTKATSGKKEGKKTGRKEQKKKRSVSTQVHSFIVCYIMTGKSGNKSLKQLDTLYLNLGSRERMGC